MVHDDVARIASLGEPVRRRLYEYVARETGPVSRDQAAEAVGVPRHTAKFHLDRLEAEGLLDVDYRRPEGRTGPGAGRPAKVYRRAGRELMVAIPDRRYQLLGGVMAAAIAAATDAGVAITGAVHEAAASAGHSAGRDTRPRAGARGQLDVVEEVLSGCGYEPRRVGEVLELANCPFGALAREHPQLVCGINVAFVGGVVDEVAQPPKVAARLDPCEGRCCVTVAKT